MRVETMEFSISKKNLIKSLKLIEGIADSNNDNYETRNVLLETTKDKKLCFAATNYGVKCKSIAEVDFKKPGKMYVDAYNLCKIAQTLKHNTNVNELHFTSEEEKCNDRILKYLLITAGQAKVRLYCQKDTKFSKLKFPEFKNQFSVKSQDLINLIDKTFFAISEDITRYALTGVCLQAKKGERSLRAIGADGFMISECFTFLDEELSTDINLIIPKKSLPELKRFAENTDQQLSISFDSEFLQIQAGGCIISTKLIQEKYPDVDQIILKDTKKTDIVAKVPGKDLMHAISLMEGFLDSGVDTMKITFEKDKLKVESHYPAPGQSGYLKCFIDCEHSAKESKDVGFFIKNFSQALQNFESVKEEKLELHFTGKELPFVLQCPNSKNLKIVIMPAKLGW